MQEFDELIEIMSRLRGEGGCSWDRKQTHASLLPYLLEESHECLDALSSGNSEWSLEELGDLLLQIVFHAQIASEVGEYDIAKIVKQLSTKLVRRHPHVFAARKLRSQEEFEQMWQDIKAEEKSTKTYDESQPSPLPIAKSEILLRLLSKRGFNISKEEYKESQYDPEQESRIGNELLTLIMAALKQGIDPERAIWKAINSAKNKPL